SPVDQEAYGFLADAAERLGHDNDARGALANLDVLEGDTASAADRAARAHRIGTISLRLGDSAAAAAALTQAVDLGVQDAGTYASLARARWQAGDRRGGRAAWAKALDADAHNADVARVSKLVK